ncbi:hypothetical protein [Anaerovibrio sp.]|uniref:hypothetical protein n=1 Tax=Anaerovibrio sp. TaxID=1872532 RepID=UPI003890FF45
MSGGLALAVLGVVAIVVLTGQIISGNKVIIFVLLGVALMFIAPPIGGAILVIIILLNAIGRTR